MADHSFHLHPGPYKLIAKGRKTIEARLNDTKRSKLKVGDTVTFINRENEKDTVTVRVTELLKIKTFEKLLAHTDIKDYGVRSADELLDELNFYYPIGEQESHGVLGIRFERA